jgi:molybdate transport system ATP-binding protein
MIKIKIQKKIKTYSGSNLLKVDAVFPKFSVTKVYGASGIGKTTFLKVIAGLIQPEQGFIEVDGQTWLDTAKKLSQSPQIRNVGFVFQDYALFPNMTVGAHLAYATKDHQLINRLLKIGQMETFVQHRPAQLSGGQQQRLAVLRALALKPQVLLMDEPFSALDDELRERLLEELKVILKEFGTTTIIVSHHSQDTAGFAERDLKIELYSNEQR